MFLFIIFFFFLMILPPTRYTQAFTLFPYTTLFRSKAKNLLATCQILVEQHNGQVPRTREALRSEEHTSELQSRPLISYAVFCLKKKKRSSEIPLDSDRFLFTLLTDYNFVN